MSSDANGSMAVYDEDGTFKGLFVTTVESMFSEFRDIVLKENLPLETAIRVVSTNAAKSIGMYPRKGGIQEGQDADLILLGKDLPRVCLPPKTAFLFCIMRLSIQL